MKCYSRLYAIISKEVLQLRRDRLTLGLIVGIPFLQIMLFGYAINTDVRHLRGAVADLSNTSLSRQLVTNAEATQVMDVVMRADSAEQLESWLKAGRVVMGLYIPNDFDRRVAQGTRAAAQLLVDGSDPVVLGAARQLAQLDIRYDTARQMPHPLSFIEVRTHYNPERRSAVNIVPALIGVILTMTMVLFTAVAIVRERERGNLELLINTPVTTFELMLGKIIPYIVIGLLQVTIILLLGVFVFSVPINGTLFDIYFASLIFIAANLTLGLLLSTLAKTQFQAMQMTFIFFLPSILLSGFMFPFDGMPKPAQYIAEILPMTHFVRIIRGIVLRGAEVFQLSQELWALAAFAVMTMSLALLRFRKRLD